MPALTPSDFCGRQNGHFVAPQGSDSMFRKPIAKEPENNELFIKLVCKEKPRKKTPQTEAERNGKARVLFGSLVLI